MSKNIYDYVLFYNDDVSELPIAYPNIKQLSNITGLTTQALHKRFSHNDIIYVGEYGIERFRKEKEDNDELSRL